MVYDDPELKPYPQNVIVMQHRSKLQDSCFSKGCNVRAQMREMKWIKGAHNMIPVTICESFM